MRTSHAVTAIVAFAAGLTAAATSRRVAHRRPLVETPAPSSAALPSAEAGVHDAVILPFARPAVSAPAPELFPRCGDDGGRTKAGAPCGARTAPGERCRHHRIAA